MATLGVLGSVEIPDGLKEPAKNPEVRRWEGGSTWKQGPIRKLDSQIKQLKMEDGVLKLDNYTPIVHSVLVYYYS